MAVVMFPGYPDTRLPRSGKPSAKDIEGRMMAGRGATLLQAPCILDRRRALIAIAMGAPADQARAEASARR